MVSFFRTMNHHHVKFVWEKRWYMCCNTLQHIDFKHSCLTICLCLVISPWYDPWYDWHVHIRKERHTDTHTHIHRHTHTHTHSDTQIPFLNMYHRHYCVSTFLFHSDRDLYKRVFSISESVAKVSGEGRLPSPASITLASAFPLMFTWLHSLPDADCSLSLPWCWIGSPS